MASRYAHRDTIHIPIAVSAVALRSDDKLAVGSVDSSVRFYDLPATKVSKAIAKLGDEIASFAWEPSTPQNIWIASGIMARLYNLDDAKLILSSSDAVHAIQLGHEEEDLLNELNISHNKKHLAFASDNGSVGVMDLTTRQVTPMKIQHSSICSSVKFIPDRANELVSSGYDSALIHFDFTQRTVQSRFDITAPPPDSGILLPRFVLSTAVSLTGLIAATTADGRLWLGTGGDKSSPAYSKPGKKRSRKWEGLRAEDGSFVNIAEGPVVACAFITNRLLVTSTLLGKLASHSLLYDDAGKLQVGTSWTSETSIVVKVNTICINERSLLVGGISKDGKGAVEIWSPS